MDCCGNKAIRSINYEKVCVNCGIIHDYEYAHPFIDKPLFYRKICIQKEEILV